MRRIGIIAALPGELKPLVQGWQAIPLAGRKGEAAWRGTVHGDEYIAVCAGMGRQAAQRACAIALENGPLDALVSIGWAGAISCGLQPGSAYILHEVVDAAGGQRFATASPPREGGAPGLKVVTLDHVAHAAEKRQLGETHRAVMVEMEAATVARIAQEHGLRFYCLKAVSDTSGEVLPDFSQYTDDQGQLRLAALLAHVALRPRYWPGLARMGRNGRSGAVALAAALHSAVNSDLDPGLDQMSGGVVNRG